MVRASDNLSLRIYTTITPSTMRLFTLMHDSQYREAIAWQNSGYNQPPHTSFFLGAGMTTPAAPKIFFGGELKGDYNTDGIVDAADYIVWRRNVGNTSDLRADGDHDGVVGNGDYTVWRGNFGAVAPAGSAAAGSSTAATSLPPTMSPTFPQAIATSTMADSKNSHRLQIEMSTLAAGGVNASNISAEPRRHARAITPQPASSSLYANLLLATTTMYSRDDMNETRAFDYAITDTYGKPSRRETKSPPSVSADVVTFPSNEVASSWR
jgi:rhamnogalacturonan lyase-like protein